MSNGVAGGSTRIGSPIAVSSVIVSRLLGSLTSLKIKTTRSRHSPTHTEPKSRLVGFTPMTGERGGISPATALVDITPLLRAKSATSRAGLIAGPLAGQCRYLALMCPHVVFSAGVVSQAG